jgi:hypothetical protein
MKQNMHHAALRRSQLLCEPLQRHTFPRRMPHTSANPAWGLGGAEQSGAGAHKDAVARGGRKVRAALDGQADRLVVQAQRRVCERHGLQRHAPVHRASAVAYREARRGRLRASRRRQHWLLRRHLLRYTGCPSPRCGLEHANRPRLWRFFPGRASTKSRAPLLGARDAFRHAARRPPGMCWRPRSCTACAPGTTARCTPGWAPCATRVAFVTS